MRNGDQRKHEVRHIGCDRGTHPRKEVHWQRTADDGTEEREKQQHAEQEID